MKNLFTIMAFAENAGGSDGKASETNARPTSAQRRNNETMGAYYKRTGTSGLGTKSNKQKAISAGPTKGKSALSSVVKKARGYQRTNQ